MTKQKNMMTSMMRVFAIGSLSLCLINVAKAAGTDQHASFSSGKFLAFQLSGFKTPSPTTSAPTTSIAPSGAPTVSSAPSANPTESPAPSPSPSETPTLAPTPPTQAPTISPTESPAPSPSPSETPTLQPSSNPTLSPTLAPTSSQLPSSGPTDAPTNRPSASPSDSPSESPSVSAAPSAKPSASPTIAPSATPSDSPSYVPTLSMAPSVKPSASPTAAPSPMPSQSPSDSPSDIPSEKPSPNPTSSPSASPSVSMAPSTSEPSVAPSTTPTQIGFKTKNTIMNIFLLSLDREMTNTALAQFEVVTLGFIRDTQGPTPGYTIDILAVTVLTQAVTYPQAPSHNGTESNASTVGLQVSFRTVGTVTEGTAPRDLDFSNITNVGFENYFGEYLYQLSQADSFFAPLAKHINATTLLSLPTRSAGTKADSKHSRNRKQYVAAVLFATMAILIAGTATIYAVRKHLRKHSNKVPRLEYPGYGTKTMSDEPELNDDEEQAGGYCFDSDVLSDLSATQAQSKHQKERAGTSTNPLQLDIIDDERIEMEEVGLTPMSAPSDYGTTRGFGSAYKAARMPVSPSAMERGTANDESGTGTFIDLNKRTSFGFGVKKWLTPRRSSPKTKSKIDLNDPPESVINFEVDEKPTKKSRKSLDPSAAKASTSNAAGILSNEQMASDDFDPQSKATKKKRKSSLGGNASFGIPVNFFGRSSDNRSEATSGNMDSMIGGSTASSFFTKMGRKSNVFTGKSNANGQEPSTYKFGSTAGRRSDANENSFAMKNENVPVLQANSNENVEASVSGAAFDFEKNRSMFERSQSSNEAPVSNTNVTKGRQHGDNAAKSVEQGPANIEREVKHTATFEADSVYSEQSELDLNALGVETTLGAIPPNFESDTPASRNSSFVGHEYGSRPIAFYPSSGAAATNEVFDEKQRSEKSGPGKPKFTLGARAMAANEEKRRISLNTAIKQGDTYDVFAPTGPIGIVVDTSKLGPAVHSLKSTSPMLGLINPGDLIIALDDEDTRNMTAASLTRLMAKKSRQRERKITLLAPDGF